MNLLQQYFVVEWFGSTGCLFMLSIELITGLGLYYYKEFYSENY